MGFSEVDRKLVEMAHQYGLSKKQIFLHVTIPYAIPYIISGLRIGLGYSWRSLIGAEMIAASFGHRVLDPRCTNNGPFGYRHCWYHRNRFVRHYL